MFKLFEKFIEKTEEKKIEKIKNILTNEKLNKSKLIKIFKKYKFEINTNENLKFLFINKLDEIFTDEEKKDFLGKY